MATFTWQPVVRKPYRGMKAKFLMRLTVEEAAALREAVGKYGSVNYFLRCAANSFVKAGIRAQRQAERETAMAEFE